MCIPETEKHCARAVDSDKGSIVKTDGMSVFEFTHKFGLDLLYSLFCSMITYKFGQPRGLGMYISI